MEKPIFFLSEQTAAKLSDQELAAKLFSGEHKIVGDLSGWKRQNEARYRTVRQIVQDEGRLGQSREQATAEMLEKLCPSPRQFSIDELEGAGRVLRPNAAASTRRTH